MNYAVLNRDLNNNDEGFCHGVTTMRVNNKHAPPCAAMTTVVAIGRWTRAVAKKASKIMF